MPTDGQATIGGLGLMMARIVSFIPALLGAIIVFAIGWFVGGALGSASAKLLRRMGFEGLSERIGFRGFLNRAGVTRMDSSAVLGEGLSWILRLVFLQIAAETLGLTQITLIINAMIAFIPNIIVAVIILGVAGFFGRMLQGMVRGGAATAGAPNTGMLSDVAYWGVMAFGIIAALNQLHIAPLVVNTLFIGVVGTLVLAFGLSFGLGGREVAGELTREWAAQARAAAKETAKRITYRDLQTEQHPSYTEDIVPPRETASAEPVGAGAGVGAAREDPQPAEITRNLG
jgi:hypothetical protein